MKRTTFFSIGLAWTAALAIGAGCVGDPIVPDGVDTGIDTGSMDSSMMDTSMGTDSSGMDAGMDAFMPTKHAYVANYNNGSGGSLKVFDMPIQPDGGSSPVLTVSGVGAPSSVRLDPSGTKIWVADGQNNKVYAFNLPLTSMSMPVTTLNTKYQPTDLGFDNNNNLWVGEFSATVERWNAPPTGMANLAVNTISSNVFAIALDANGGLYAAMGGTPQIAFFTYPQAMGQMPTFTNSNVGNSASGLLVTNGKLYVDSYASGALLYFNLPMNAQATPLSTGVNGTYGWRLSLSPTNELVYPGISSNTIAFLPGPNFTTIGTKLSLTLSDPRCVAFDK